MDYPAPHKSILEQVKEVPQEPGCYLWKDEKGEVIYVGKAKNLRSRMLQYVHLTDDRAKIPLLMEQVASFDYIVVSSEHEALVLERNLIAQYHPYFNVEFKDDKTYPYIALTMRDAYPAIKYTREKHKKGNRYFGPYTDARSARETIETIRKVFPICSANCVEWKRCQRKIEALDQDLSLIHMALADGSRPCFDYQVGKGPGVCVGAITVDDYAKQVKQVEQFLSGKRKAVIEQLRADMQDAAAELDFERAARYKKSLDAIDGIKESQTVSFSSAVNIDFIGLYREETISCACVFVLREGRLIRSAEFILNKGADVGEEELVEGFLKRYYEETADLPKEIDVPFEIADADMLESWLGEKKGSAVRLHLPLRGEKRALLEKASQNAKHALMRYMVRTGYADDRSNRALLELESALALPAAPLRIECFDISTLHGNFTVASMVVFENGRPEKSQYRRFKVRAELDEANDFVSMSEVLGRRYSSERMADERFGRRPDLLVVDGGKPQLSAAIKQLEELGLDIPVCGLAKSDEEIFVTWDETPVVLPTGSASLNLIKQVRDESHRFAITFHRELRGKAMTRSILDEIEGVGPKRKRALLRHFGSMKKLRAASVAEIAEVDGISESLAESIKRQLSALMQEVEANKVRGDEAE